MKSNWEKIKIGEFFIADIILNEETFVYQKIDESKSGGYNAVLLNSGELCYLHINANYKEHFQKVEVSIDIKNVED